MKSTPEPSPRPVSIHGDAHHHGALPVIAAMLGVFLVIETIVLGFVVTKYVLGTRETQENQAQIRELVEARVEEAKKKLVPFLYTDNGWKDGKMYSYLKQVDRQTGEETTLLEGKDLKFISLIATPQVGYDGRVFIHQGCGECDNPYLDLYEFNVNTKQVKEYPLDDDDYVIRSSVAVSPDQTKLAIAQYEDVEWSDYSEIRIVDLLTGEVEVVGEYADGTYVSEYFGQNAFGGAAGFNLHWQNQECFNVTTYERPASVNQMSRMDYKGTDTFCVGETGQVE